ncbi:MAG: ADP-ribosylglycohydrolase family protein [Verrucomicrobia bacterium]|nr:ADP-ribosylglycohydrolase family protein [Verrucomicrobiota bacterium]
MKRLVPVLLAFCCAQSFTCRLGAAPKAAIEYRRLSLAEYRDKMKAGWVGQMAGVTWGAPTEFKFKDQIVPLDKVPVWKPSLINDAFKQDDIYVEMTFLRTLEQYGLNASIRQAGLDFANSGYPLWCANNAGRKNLRAGIAPPDSGHPRFNKCPNDIDYQIEADYSGLIGPGLPQVAIEMGEKFGRLMNYGDGLYAGQFVGAMYAAAFFESDPEKIVETALQAIPGESQYAEMVRDLVAWHRADPKDWEKTWQLCLKKYRENPEYQKASNGAIDCKINGACVLLGLLYGERDPDRTIVIAMRGGEDSDCNPSTAGGVLFTTMGLANVPERFTKELSQTNVFSHTAYSFPALIAVCEKLAREMVVKCGGRVEKKDGQEFFLLPVKATQPSKMELSWAPGPIANSRFTPGEMEQIKVGSAPAHMHAEIEEFARGWQIANCGTDMDPGLRAEWGGKKNVLVTHPLDDKTGCVISKKIKVPADKKARLRLVVAHDPQGDFDLIVRADGRELLRKAVSKVTATEDPWLVQEGDLSGLAGKKAPKIEIINQPSGWSFEAAYWGEIAIITE